jgi:hypothetical protein
MSTWPPPWQSLGTRSFASGSVTSSGPPPEPGSMRPGGLGPQPPEQPADVARPAGDDEPGSTALTVHSQPDDQELDMDQLMTRWEEMMDAKADPLQILDTVWSNIDSEPVGAGGGNMRIYTGTAFP